MARSRAARSSVLTLILLSTSLLVACGGGEGSASMEEGRGQHTTTLLADGRVLVTGGRGSKALASAEMYDLSTNLWSPAGNMSGTRYGTMQRH